MSNKPYQPYDFFRRCSPVLLKAYFEQKGVVLNVDFEKLSPRKMSALNEAWQELSSNVRNDMDIDFKSIHSLASIAGVRALVERAVFEEDLIDTFQQAGIEGEHDRAFWTFMNRQQYWKAAQVFNYADNVPASYYVKRQDVGVLSGFQPAKVDEVTLKLFATSLSAYFFKKDGRGERCLVEHFVRQSQGRERDYFFAYPEDFARTSLEWSDDAMERRNSHPAFEIVFVYCQVAGELDVYMRAGTKHITVLQKAFGSVVLGVDLPEVAKKKETYDLSAALDRNFNPVIVTGSGIKSMRVSSMRFFIRSGKNEEVVLKAKSNHDPKAVYDLFDRLTANLSKDLIEVNQIGFEVEFEPNESRREKKRKNFTVTLPNTCALGLEGQEGEIRKVLLDSGIQLRPVTEPELITNSVV